MGIKQMRTWSFLLFLFVIVVVGSCSPIQSFRLHNETSDSATFLVTRSQENKINTLVYFIEAHSWADVRIPYGAARFRIINGPNILDYEISDELIKEMGNEWHRRFWERSPHQTLPVRFLPDGKLQLMWDSNIAADLSPIAFYTVPKGSELESACWNDGAYASLGPKGTQPSSGGIACTMRAPLDYLAMITWCSLYSGLGATTELVRIGIGFPIWNHDFWKRLSQEQWTKIAVVCSWIWLNGGDWPDYLPSGELPDFVIKDNAGNVIPPPPAVP